MGSKVGDDVQKQAVRKADGDVKEQAARKADGDLPGETGGEDSELVALATVLGREMRAAGALIVTAESCTGGLLARALTETAGSSEWFERGFVTYSNEAKADLLGVRPATLQAHGAVSEQTAREMAAGALRNSPAGLALAVTGIAGPGGATADKPVGTVCFGWGVAVPDDGSEPLVASEQRHFAGNRAAIRRQAAAYALAQATQLLRQRLRDCPPVG
jgi:nicotinamide-nucleotide amidase